jgi:hypothetical protein
VIVHSTMGESYSIDNSTDPVNITVTTTAASTTSVSLGAVTFPNGTTNGTDTVLSNMNGTLYYEIRDPLDTYPPVESLNLTYFQTMLGSNNSNFVHSQADFLSYLYANPRFLYISSINVTNGTNTSFPIYAYEPNYTYNFTTIFVSSDNSYTSPLTVRGFTTPNVPYPIYTLELNFSSQLNRTQRNLLLCWFVTNTGAPVNYILNLRGESCNQNGTDPSRLLYRYNYHTDQSNSTLIYLYSYDNGTNSNYTTAFLNLLTGSSLDTTQAASLSAYVGVNVTSSTYEGNRTYTTVEQESRTTPNISQPDGTDGAVYNNSVISFNVSDTQNSIVYWAINNGTGTTPTIEDVLNCGNSNDTSAFYSCGRVLLIAN